MRWAGAMPGKASQPCALEAAWVWRCASSVEERSMARVAVVTGGSRGIGAAISKALGAAGYKVAANYAGNDEAASRFNSECGIPVYKWDVSSHEACAVGLKKVE